jgi:transcriptional regulator with XRE-family HTH domain
MSRKKDPTDWEQEMGLRLKALRQAAGLTQEGLARMLDVTLGAVHNWERGKRTFKGDRAVQLCEALGCTLDQLYGVKPLPRGKSKKGGSS